MDNDFAQLVEAAHAMMADRGLHTFSKHGIDFTTQYVWDLDRAEMTFIDRDRPVATAKLQLVGSIAGNVPTWLWGWANENVASVSTHRLAEVRRYGQEQRFERLTEPSWPYPDNDGHDMMVLSAAILSADSCFYYNKNNPEIYFILYNFVNHY
jgi:hypothetical protein